MIVKSVLKNDIHDTIEMECRNSDTSDITKGSVVIIDVSDLTERKVKCTITANSSLAKGVAISDINPGKMGSIVIFGITKAKVVTGATAIAVGDRLSTSATSGKLGLATSNPIAVALAPVAANQDTMILVDVRPM